MKYDFSGWATKANLKCSDGRTITPDAFKHMDGCVVPLVWNHQHNDPNEILGQALLEHREGKGVYAYCTFNNTESGKTAKLLVQHGDISALSIFANNLQEKMSNVLHGNIREVSLVLAGANPGAYIDSVIKHGEESDSEAVIYTGENISLYHSDNDDDEEENNKKGEEEMSKVEDEKTEKDLSKEEPKSESKEESKDTDKKETIGDVLKTLNADQKAAVDEMIKQAVDKAKKEDKPGSEEMAHSEDEKSEEISDETIEEVFNTLNDKQKKVVYAMIAMSVKDAKGEKKDDEEDEKSEGGKETMKHNVFENEDVKQENTLSHSEMTAILEDARRNGSLKDAFLQHGITDIDVLFPDAKTVTPTPEFIKRNDDWVNKVLNGVHHTPFSRIKTIFADITADEARAKGYTKGNLKIEEVFKLLKRVTNPTTVYKKQKLDRDDIIDITDMDVVAWLKQELRMMLNEELARAILVGDGRSAESNDKINEENIRPIWTDADLYTVKVPVTVAADATADAKAKAFIKACVKSRKQYKGSGNPSMYMSEDILTDCLLLEDLNGRRIYDTVEKLAAALTVKEIIPVTVMDNLTRTVKTNTHTLAGEYVNLNDYNIGADKGGAISMFDDFDIDYNQQKYLMETRCSGALTKPYAAVAIEFVTPTASKPTGDDEQG